MGRYTDTGVLHVKYQGRTAAFMDLSFLEEEFPPWEFEARWLPPEDRLTEPVLGEPGDHLELAPGHAGPPQYLLPGVDHPPVRSRGPGGQRAQTPGGRGGAGARGRRGAAAPAGFAPGAGPEPGPQPRLLRHRHLPHDRGDH